MLSLNNELFDLLKKNNLNEVEEYMEEKEKAAVIAMINAMLNGDLVRS